MNNDNKKPTVEDVVKVLHMVYDPELNVSLGEAGLVKPEYIKIDEENKKIWVLWVPTTPLCPLIPQIGLAIKVTLERMFPGWKAEPRLHPDIPNAEVWNEQMKDESMLKAIKEEMDARGWWPYFIRPRPDLGLEDVPYEM